MTRSACYEVHGRFGWKARYLKAQRLDDYLHHRLSLDEIVSWAEAAMMEEDFEPSDFETIRDIVARIGLSDVRAFGLTWEDCEEFLTRLGYKVRLDVIPSR